MTKRAEEVTLQDLENVDSSSLVDFGSPFISHLILEGCSHITDVGLIAVMKRCPNLSVIKISWLHRLTDRSIKELAKRLHYRLVSERKRCPAFRDVLCRVIAHAQTHAHNAKCLLAALDSHECNTCALFPRCGWGTTNLVSVV